MATNTWTVTVAATSLSPPPYGFDDTFGAKEGDMVPYEPLMNVTSGVVRCIGINDYGGGSGIEIYWNSSATPPNDPITMQYEEITEIRLDHSGGTLILDPRPTGDGGDLDAGSSYESSGETYMWFAGVGGIWTVADVATDYTVEADSTLSPPPTDPDYNQGTRVFNRRNPGGGVAFQEAEYTETQSFEISGKQNQGRPGSGGSPGKGRGGEVIINLPAQAGTFDLDTHIEAYDYGSGTWYGILTGAKITGGGTAQRLKVAPFVSDVANVSANDLLPYLWRVRVEHGDATAVTYSVEYRV